ncbi:MAG: HD domain-containing phosphohydrolase [Candidatus Omnitrophota bacterium]|jgi:putative nucleotidyltransferase with HDIG domain
MADKKFLPVISFRARIALLLALAMVLVVAATNLLVYRYLLDSEMSSVRNNLMTLARSAAVRIDADALVKVPLNPGGVNTREYMIVAEELRRIMRQNPDVKYIYTLALTDKKGILKFIVDPVMPTDEQQRMGLSSRPGDLYDASRFPEMVKAFYGPTADKKMVIDEWGAALSGYAPVFDSDSNAVAIVGVDISVNDIYAKQRAARNRAILALALAVFLSVLISMFLSRRISGKLVKLIEGTRRLAGGDLAYKIELEGTDEMGELAHSFNQMASRLSESKKDLLTYFYRVVQSFVRILEARDSYTKGHSERVAEYAGRIAAGMGLPKDKVELLKRATLLHDIGKMGIEERILNKKEPLTQAEWTEIRKHPVIGENILKPVLLTDDMLDIVRSHHERYDGKGYPDGLAGDKINLLAAIVTVADSYDAMTSARAYRPPLNKQQAIDELKRNRGTQFNPKVVDALIDVLNDERRG